MRARLLELINHLHMVARQILLVEQINILNPAVIKHKIINIVVMHLARFLNHIFRRPI